MGGDSADGQDRRAAQSLQPWQFFVLAALGCATAATFMARGEGVAAVVLLTVLLGATAFVGMAALRTVLPLVSPSREAPAALGERTRAVLEREKMLALRTLKELEFDRAMGKVSEQDFHEMSAPLRARAARLMRQLDASGDYRARIEADLATRLATRVAEDHLCAACSTSNDADARFCKSCGAKLG
jgi:hypothetical protein